MSMCTRARDLFGAYWDDETTRAEREWLEAHLAGCAACRDEYDALTRTLEAVSSLPRLEASSDLATRALAAARRSAPAPDRIVVRETPAWAPIAAVASWDRVAGSRSRSSSRPIAGPSRSPPAARPCWNRKNAGLDHAKPSLPRRNGGVISPS